MNQKPRTILIIDDNVSVSHALKALLGREGFKVLHAGHGKDGCQLAASEHPTLILCDELMPHMDGYETLTWLKGTESTAHIPVIMIGGSDPNGERNWVALGAFCFLPKPFRIAELFDEVRRALSAQTH